MNYHDEKIPVTALETITWTVLWALGSVFALAGVGFGAGLAWALLSFGFRAGQVLFK